MTIMAISSAACAGRAVGLLDSLDDYGETGEKIEDSVFVRAYCCLCGEAIPTLSPLISTLKAVTTLMSAMYWTLEG